VRALSREQVDGVVSRFAAVNPYDRAAVPGSVLKVEDDNYALCSLAGHDRDRYGRPQQCVCTRERLELSCFAISAKRHALSNLEGSGEPVLRKWSEHGLGHLLNPTDPDADERDWMKQVWLNLAREGQGLPVTEPAWLDLPAVSRVSVSGWQLNELLKGLDRAADYLARVKPGNFLLIAQADPYMSGDDWPVLVAPYERNPRKWLGLPWLDRKTSDESTVTTDDREAGSGVVRVKSYRDVLDAYRVHPDAKSLGPDGQPCGPETVGLLGRRHVTAASLSHVGKETNKLEQVTTGEEDDPEEVYALYERPGERLDVLRQALALYPRVKVAREAGITRANLTHIIQAKAVPRPRTLRRLENVAQRLTVHEMSSLGSYEPGMGLLDLATLLRFLTGRPRH
jgi:hypothetical protein